MGIPKGIRAIIAIGEVKGIMENQTANELCGLVIILPITTIDNISGAVTGSINCCVSVSWSTAEPTAANKALYKT